MFHSKKVLRENLVVLLSQTCEFSSLQTASDKTMAESGDSNMRVLTRLLIQAKEVYREGLGFLLSLAHPHSKSSV